jgi:hypothetical protein
MKTSGKLMNENLMLGQKFKSVAQLLLKLEDGAKDWHLAPIRGHPHFHSLFLSSQLTLPCPRNTT